MSCLIFKGILTFMFFLMPNPSLFRRTVVVLFNP